MAEALPMIQPRVCLADDEGELAATRALLDELHIEWLDHTSPREGGVDLLISTPRHALSREGGTPRVRARTHIVIASNLSRTLRSQLERHPCDFVVESPMHPAALRLLIEHSLYRGPERRGTLRALMASEVKIKAGFRTKKATLMQLSERGAGLMVDAPISSEQISLRLPPDWTAAGKLELKGTVVDQHLFSEGGHLVSIVFNGLSGATRRELCAIMKAQAGRDGMLKPGAAGAAQLADDIPRPASLDSSSLAPSDEAAGSERRQSERRPFRKRVLASLRGQAQAVVSQDISAGGMRLEADSGLAVGEELKLALYGSKGTAPIVLRARVVNDHGEHGLGLRFEDVSQEMQARLDRLVTDSSILGPASGEGEGSERPKMVLTEILDRGADD